MREEVLVELKKRIDALQTIAKPNDIETGMSGSFVRFNYYLQSHTAMTNEEFNSGIYDDWLQKEHKRVYEEVNVLTW